MLAVADTKIDSSFPSAQSFLEWNYSLYISHKSSGLLVYIKATLRSRQLSLPKFQFRIQALLSELNLRKKLLVMTFTIPRIFD